MAANPIEAAIFFDNSEYNISLPNGVCPLCRDVLCVKIRETSEAAPTLKWDESPLKDYTESLGANTYVDVCKIVVRNEGYDPVSGIQAREVDVFTNWLKDTAHIRNRAAIFDWDRTITMVEGIHFLMNSANVSDIRSKAIAYIRETQTSLPLYKDHYEPLISQLDALPDCTASDILIYLLGGEARL